MGRRGFASPHSNFNYTEEQKKWNCKEHYHSLSSLKYNSHDKVVCLSVSEGRGSSPGHVSNRRPAPLHPKQKRAHHSAVRGWGGGRGDLETSCHLQPIKQPLTLQLSWAGTVSCPAADSCTQTTMNGGSGIKVVGGSRGSKVIWDANVMQVFHNIGLNNQAAVFACTFPGVFSHFWVWVL